MKSRFALVTSRAILVPLIVLSASVPGDLHSQDAPLLPEDFSKRNSVTLLLVEAKRGKVQPEQGLTHAYGERDGWTTLMNVQGVACRSLSLTDQGYPKGYFYFALNPTFKEQDVTKVKIDVEYFDGFDGQEGVFGLQYDATGSADGAGFSSRQLLPNVPLKGSGKWLKATFHVRTATFQNSQNSRSDFRLWASPPELCVSRVTVTLEPQAPAAEPLKFDSSGEAKLREWNVQWDSGDKPSFSRPPVDANGLSWLQIRAPGAPAMGSWRTAVLLEAGEYEFVGRARTEGLAAGTGATGVTLRASGHGGPRTVNEAPDGMTLTYGFTMPALDYVELVCDFRGAQGSARFDLDSLKLIRKSKATR